MTKDTEHNIINDEPVGQVINPIPKPKQEIGIDLDNSIYQNIITAGTTSVVNSAEIERFTTLSRGRDQIYALLDTMAEDSKISAVLETYAEDATEYNDKGQIVWVESDDANIASYVSFLLDSLRIDKNIYNWTYNLCKYGDVYLRLYRKSDYQDALFGQFANKKERLDENVKIHAYAKNDNYVRYVEMVPNPAEAFELTKFGKTVGYIKTSVPPMNYGTTASSELKSLTNVYHRYKFYQRDVELFQPTEFVHACLDDNSSRIPEEVEIFLNVDQLNDADANSNSSGSSSTYTVRRGQSVLQNSYKVWRELQLLESSVLLSRVTQSSISRIIQIEVGDMPKEQVPLHVNGIKNMVEQKSSIAVGNNMQEYTNPGPIVNNIYVPTHNGKGAITAQALGESYDPKSLVDLNYYLNDLYGSLRAPKQYFNQTDDATGFNGGTSLTLISARYAKAIKRIQNVMIQAVTDIINLMLIDSDLSNYINKFEIKMLAPATEEDKTRKENLSSRVSLVNDVMNLLTDIDDSKVKLNVLRSLLSDALSDQNINHELTDYIEKLEAEEQARLKEEAELESDETTSEEEPIDVSDSENGYDEDSPIALDDEEYSEEPVDEEPVEKRSERSRELPRASELNVDLTDSEAV